jgi:hypothetical protein
VEDSKRRKTLRTDTGPVTPKNWSNRVLR